MHITTPALLVGLASCVAATGWSNAKPFSSPQNTNNQCSDEQKSGYDWSDLNTGSFSSYGSNKFSGFTCSNSFGKRSDLTARTFQDKCITGDVQQHPSISCDTGKSMSINQMHVSSEHDTEVECHYSMPDGSTCRSTYSCSVSGSLIENEQCGGAVAVTFKPIVGDSRSCNIGVHDISFNCGPYTTSSIQSSTSIAPASSSKPVATTSVQTSSSPCSSSNIQTSSVPVHQSSSTQSSSSIVISSIDVKSSSSSSPMAVSSTTMVSSHTSSTSILATTSSTTISSSKSILVYSSQSTLVASSSIAAVTSSSTAVSSSSTTHSSPCSTAVLTQSSSSSTVASSSTQSISSLASLSLSSSATKCSTSKASPSSAPVCPDVLPSCLNTWLHETQCKDNSDYDCFCKDSTFVTHVMGCVEAWSPQKDEGLKAAAYFQGLCAKYIPQNPAIVTACPHSRVPVTSEAATSSATVYTTVTTSTIYSISMTTSAVSGTTATSIVPVTTTIRPVTVIQSSESHLPTSTYAPSTITIYSTQAITVTSCASGIKNCPAQSTTVVYSLYPVSTSILTPTVTSAPSYTGPSSVITYSIVLTVPVTCTIGQCAGSTITGSSSLTTVSTILTVPQVYLTTATLTASGGSSTSVGLAAGLPAPVSASATISASGWVTSSIVSASNSALAKSTGPATYTGAATSISIGSVSAVIIGALASFLLL